MDELQQFLQKIEEKKGGTVKRQHETILELTRSFAGLYLRITHQGENRYSLVVVRGSSEKPKQHWYLGKVEQWNDLPRGQIRERCEKVLGA